VLAGGVEVRVSMREAVDAPLNPNLLLPKFQMLPSFLLSLSSAEETSKDLSIFFFSFVYKYSVEISPLPVLSVKVWETIFRGFIQC
jgi:hypothetical protein